MLLPERNRRDLDEIPADARARLNFVWVEKVDAAVEAALDRWAANDATALAEQALPCL